MFAATKIKPWSKKNVFLDGVVTVTKGYDEEKGRFAHAVVHDPKPLYDALGPDLGRKAHLVLVWTLTTVEFGERAPFPFEETGLPRDVLKGVREVKEYGGRVYNQILMPTLICDHDGTYTGWCSRGKTVEDPERGFLLGLMQWASGAHYWDNSAPPLRLNTRAKDKSHWEGQPWPAEIIEDSGWSGTQKGRCYHVYDRAIKFERPLTDEEVERFKAKLFATERGPGIGNPYVASEDNQTFRLRGSRDSSD